MARRIALVLAGGGGTRLWPASTPSRPKQLFEPLLQGDGSLVAQTIARVAPIVDETWVVTTQDQVAALTDVLSPGAAARIIAEPRGRNTAPAIALAARHVQAVGSGAPTTLLALPADHHVRDPEAFRRHLLAACLHAEADDVIATLGIEPDRPATGFGYLERDPEPLAARDGDDGVAVYRARRFVEKPDEARARSFVESGHFLWNAGIFVMPLARIATELDRHCGPVWRALAAIAEPGTTPEQAAAAAAGAYATAKSEPIDVAVMEKQSDLRVIPADVGWTDLGSWEAVFDLAPKDGRDNAALGAGPTPLVLDGRGNLVWAESAQVAVLGIEDLIVVQSGDRILVIPRSAAQDVKRVVEALGATRPKSD